MRKKNSVGLEWRPGYAKVEAFVRGRRFFFEYVREPVDMNAFTQKRSFERKLEL